MERGASTNAIRNHHIHTKPTLSALRRLQTAYVMKGGRQQGRGGGGREQGKMEEESSRRTQGREQDQYMPIANVIRIMRRILPGHAKISDDAKETIQECVSEYISFITGEANDRCQREQRKTVTAEDVLWAMAKLGFDDYIQPLTVFINRYRDIDGGERGVVSVRGGGSEMLYSNSKQVDTASSSSSAGAAAVGFLPAGYMHGNVVNYDRNYYNSSDQGSSSASSQQQPLSLLSYDHPYSSSYK